MKNEIIVINKEKGLTSRDVVNKLCKILNTKKVGHTGTLDPMATGVLICLTNKYTKLVDLITSLNKEYIATIKLGIKTDTLDITGNIVDSNNNYQLDRNAIVKILNSFIGPSKQTVPIYSAVKINGKKLYEYARNKENIKLPERDIIIEEIELLDYHDDLIKFRCIVSKGTYIRSLINDICNKLNVIGTMSDLERTRQGSISINLASKIEDIENNNYKSLKLEDALDLKKVDTPDYLFKKILNGNTLNLYYNGYILFVDNAKEIALYYFENNIGKLKILFN